MNPSTQSQPTPLVPSINDLAPPLTDKGVAAVQPVAKQPTVGTTNVEPWVPAQMPVEEQAEATQPGNSISTLTSPAEQERVGQGDYVKKDNNGNSDRTGSPLINRVLQQRGSAASEQQDTVQKDNTLIVFVVLCLVLVAIACSIYFVADREAQVSDKTRVVTTLPQSFTPNPMFGKPINRTKVAPAAASKGDKSLELTKESTTQLAHMDYIEAEYSARHASELSPGSGATWLALGRALYAQGRYREAKEAFKTCLRCKSDGKISVLARSYMSDIPNPN